MSSLKTSEFNYNLPENLIAHEPPVVRGESRLMVIDKQKETISHHRFQDLDQFLNPEDCLIFNNTKVINARLMGQRQSGGKVEIFLLKPLQEGQWLCLIKPVKKLNVGETILISDKLSCTLLKKHENPGEHIVRLDCMGQNPFDTLESEGQVPLPPYIKHASTETANRFKERYQTVFAQNPGAVAAPTAGLHFNDEQLEQLKDKVHISEITLHVGYGTFKPIQSEYIADHDIHQEMIDVSQNTIDTINKSKAKSGKIVAVGTTVTRALETAFQQSPPLTGPQVSGIYITPGYTFKCIDALITNFHLPKSSLMVLVSALAGTELMREAYMQAIKEKYRFYSFGDAMLIL